MGYGHSRETVDARLHYFDELLRGEPQVWFTDPDPAITRRLLNQIREALWIAHKYHASSYPELARAYELFSIHYVEDGRLEARFKTSANVIVDRGGQGTQTPVHGIVSPAAGFKVVPQVGITTAEECIDSWQRHLPSSDPLQLLRTSLSYDELEKLYAFCERNKPALMMLVGESTLTISLHEAEVATIAGWKPQPTPEIEEEYDV